MKPLKQHILILLLGIILPGMAFCSCSEDETGVDKPQMTISFRMDASASHGSRADTGTGYEDGTDWENYINIAGGDYRIIFFDSNNKCITLFTPKTFKEETVGAYVDYTLEGDVPSALMLYTKFKTVVLANWGTYPDIVDGVTTLDDLCCPVQTNGSRLGQFSCFASAGYQIDDTDVKYIPMFGLKDYTGVNFLSQETTDLSSNSGGINLLRSVAKVEVIFNTTDAYTLAANPYISRYNQYGFCAPEGVNVESDYNHSAWADNYMPGKLHIPGGVNDSAEKNLTMTEIAENGVDKKYVCYLPEYRNVEASEKDCKKASAAQSSINKSCIVIPLTRNGATHLGKIEFAAHSNGEATTPHNIERNNLYRFTITHVGADVKWTVEALNWNGRTHQTIVM